MHLIPNVQQVSKSLPASEIMAGVTGSHECPQGMTGGVRGFHECPTSRHQFCEMKRPALGQFQSHPIPIMLAVKSGAQYPAPLPLHCLDSSPSSAVEWPTIGYWSWPMSHPFLFSETIHIPSVHITTLPLTPALPKSHFWLQGPSCHTASSLYLYSATHM